jgi:hypothetical protein
MRKQLDWVRGIVEPWGVEMKWERTIIEGLNQKERWISGQRNTKEE